MRAKQHLLRFFHVKTNFFNTLLTSNQTSLMLIRNHPFNQQVLNGTLPKSVFGHYLRDDFFYLNQFADVLQILSTRAGSIKPDLAKQLKHLGEDIIGDEQRNQLRYKKYLFSPTRHKPGAAITDYTQYLAKTAKHTPLPVGLTSILPCFWVYHELGKLPHDPALLHNDPYKEWIRTYSNPEFVNATKNLARAVDELGNQSSPELQKEMAQTFKHALACEHDFFDEVYSGSGLKLSA